LRIAINTRFLLPGRLEGMGWYTHELVRRLVVRHPQHTYLFLFDRAFDPQFLYTNNVVPRVVFPPARHPVLFYLWFEHAVPRVLHDWKADVFFSPDNFLSLSTPVPTLLTIHDLIPLQAPEQVTRWSHRLYYQRYLPKFLKRADHILTISEHVKRSIHEVGGIDPEKITVNYNGCRDGFKPLESPEKQAVLNKFSDGKPYFFYTGAIHPRKNIPRLVRAYTRFRASTGAPHLLLLGGRFLWDNPEVTDAIRASAYQSDIRLLGYVPEGDLPGLMGAATALVYPSLHEGFGLPVLEAMSAEVPVLTSNTTALPEVAGDAALLVDPYSEDQIADGLVRLYRDPAFAQDLVQKGRLQREKFSWDTAADVLMERLLETTQAH
jgi:glycosyltransferase involved in cell wall biosynthesis